MKRKTSSIPRLTVNGVAAAMMRGERRGLRSLAAGIFLSLFLVSAMALSVQGMILARREQTAQKVGREDFILFDYPEKTDASLRDTGHFDVIGHVTVTARLAEGERYVGFYDETAASLMNRRVMEGRMPEKPGELAVDQSALEYLRTEAKVGDAISLDLTPLDGAPETRAFTLVGVLMDQSLETNVVRFGSGRLAEMPALLVCPEEPAFATGRLAVHRLMTLASGATRAQALADNWTRYDGWLYAVYYDGRLLDFYDIGNELDGLLDITTLVVILLGLSLALCAGVGIAQSMESQLTKRVEEIGMLRAVGATRRQIRRVFGRQTWLVALILAPFSLAAGGAFAWGLSKLLPETVLFRPIWGVLAPMLILGVLCVWLSSSLPLRRASRVMPMSVIRDTQLLRKAKRVKSQAAFNPAWLLAKRQTRLYPTRQIGAALMAALTLFCAGVGVLGMSSLMQGSGIAYDYEILNQGFFWDKPQFSDWDDPGRFLTEGDLSQLRALPHAENVTTMRIMSVTLLADEAADYLTYFNPYLAGEDARPEGWYREAENDEKTRGRAALAQACLNTEKTLAEYSLQVVTLTQEQVNLLRALVVEGRVDMDALDAGREVLAYAPAYVRTENATGGSGQGPEHEARLEPGEKVTRRWENDFFRAGEALDLVQLMGESDAEEMVRVCYEGTDEDYAAWLERCERRDARVTVGAVLKAGGLDNRLGFLGDGCLLTTEKGLRALGLRPREYYEIDMYLDVEVDEEMGEFLSGRVKAIAARAENAYVYDGVAFARTRRRELGQTMLAFIAMTLMFFAVTVGMVSGSVYRRIRADQRMIGTLRAVGADARVLMKCYGAQIGAGLIAGLVAALIIVTLLMTLVMYAVPGGTMALTLGVMIALAALCLAFCALSLRLSLRETMAKSIVENIREL